MRSPITTHVLDLGEGRPAAGVQVRLEQEVSGSWIERGAGVTDDDGRIEDLLRSGTEVGPSIWRLTFATGDYYRRSDRPCFFPEVRICFRIDDPLQHYHVPLLLTPYGYSTYRGS